MIVFDASTLVSATFRRTNVPSRAVRLAFRVDRLAVSEPVLSELVGVLARPKLARILDPELRSELLWQLDNPGVSFEPAERVTDCRDPKTSSAATADSALRPAAASHVCAVRVRPPPSDSGETAGAIPPVSTPSNASARRAGRIVVGRGAGAFRERQLPGAVGSRYHVPRRGRVC